MKMKSIGLIAACLVAAACESSTSHGPAEPVPAPAPLPSSPPPRDPLPLPAPAPVCAASHGPTIHEGGDLAADETWTAEGSPHVVLGTVRVRNGKTLTIEPCAVVQVAEKQELLVATPGTPNSGAIIAEGTEQRPIRIEGKDGARWGQLFVAAPGTARLAHVTLSDGGGAGTAAIVGQGNNTTQLLRTVFLDHVTVERSASSGVSMSRATSFIDGSRDLVVTEAKGAPMVLTEYALGAMPRGKYVGNGADEIVIAPEGYVEQDTTIKETGVPYRVGTSKGDLLRVGRQTSEHVSTLTIEPGVTMRFVEGGGIAVEIGTGLFTASGVLVARGTAERPIVLTSAQPQPKAGDWRGLWFGGDPSANNVVEHVRIEYGGGECFCALSTCSDIDRSEGAVIFTHRPPSAFIKDTTIAHSDGHGIVLGYTGEAVDFAPANTFEDLAGCAQTLPRTATCPSPLPACR